MTEKNKNDGFLVPVSKSTAVSVIREQKVPAPERGRNNEIILEEEVYLKNLEKVINKQFFPLMHKKDINEEPQDFETITQLSAASMQNDVDKLTVNQYMAKYNSEDNQAFEKLMDKDEETWQKKYWWIAKQAEDYREKQLALQAASDSKNNMIENKKEQILMLENGEVGQNSLMFMPTMKSKQIKTYSDPESAEFKKISYENTRFDDKVLLQLNERPDSRQSTSQPALGVDRLRTQNILGIEEKPSQYTHISYNNRPKEPEKPDRIQGYNLLTMPSPSPNNQTPMMTWGEVEGTPLNIGRDRGFKIQESSKRDKLVENLPLEHARKKKMNQDQQKQKMKEMLTPTPMRRESSILRNTSSILTPSKKISKDHSQSVSRKSSALTKPKVPPSSFPITNKSISGSNKGLPDNLLHFD